MTTFMRVGMVEAHCDLVGISYDVKEFYVELGVAVIPGGGSRGV